MQVMLSILGSPVQVELFKKHSPVRPDGVGAGLGVGVGRGVCVAVAVAVAVAVPVGVAEITAVAVAVEVGVAEITAVAVAVAVEVGVAEITGVVVDVAVAVGVGLQLPPLVTLISTEVIVFPPSNPPTATAVLPTSVPAGNERIRLRLGPTVQLSVTGSYT